MRYKFVGRFAEHCLYTLSTLVGRNCVCVYTASDTKTYFTCSIYDLHDVPNPCH